MMNTKLALLCICGGLVCQATRAIEPEPDWEKRAAELTQEEFIAFKTPKAGDRVTVVRRIGGELSGSITAIGKDTIALDGKQFQSAQLTPDTCDALFADVHAQRAAIKRTRTEREDYQNRRTAEEETVRQETQRRQDEAKRLERQRQEAAEQVRLQSEEQERRVAQQARQLAKQEEERTARIEAIGFGVGMFLLCILGFAVYILPAIIAFNRGHQNAGAILALNILLGWTFLGWVVAIVWSLTQTTTKEQVAVNNHPSSPSMPESQRKKIIIKRQQ